jgi:hypothetical protein
MDEGKWKGEGNYKAARDYDEATTAHAQDKGKVKAEADAAKKAMEGSERSELEQAEEEGKSHAKK